MKVWYTILILVLVLIFPVSGYPYITVINNNTKTPSASATYAGTSGGNTVAVNSSGVLFATFFNTSADTMFGPYTMNLAWSLDDGVTWNETALPTGRYAGSPLIMIDSQDTLHFVYADGNTAYYYYRNYTLANGWGDEILFTSDSLWAAGTAMGDNEMIHIAYECFNGGMAICYRNLSHSLVMGDVEPVTGSVGTTWFPMLAVGNDNTVHIVWGEWNAPDPYAHIRYRNLSSGGWSPTNTMVNMGEETRPFKVLVDANNKIHLLFGDDSMVGTLYYANASGATNFNIGDAMLITTGTVFGGSTMSIDKAGTIHFAYFADLGSGIHLTYRNFTSNGFGTEYVLDDRPTFRYSFPYAYNPSQNNPTRTRLENGMAFVFSNGTEFANGNSFEYGYFPEANFTRNLPVPTPTPYINPFNVVTVDSTAQMIQMVITIGILLSILAIIAMLVMRYIGSSD